MSLSFTQTVLPFPLGSELSSFSSAKTRASLRSSCSLRAGTKERVSFQISRHKRDFRPSCSNFDVERCRQKRRDAVPRRGTLTAPARGQRCRRCTSMRYGGVRSDRVIACSNQQSLHGIEETSRWVGERMPHSVINDRPALSGRRSGVENAKCEEWLVAIRRLSSSLSCPWEPVVVPIVSTSGRGSLWLA